jgi:hypothetical protein
MPFLASSRGPGQALPLASTVLDILISLKLISFMGFLLIMFLNDDVPTGFRTGVSVVGQHPYGKTMQHPEQIPMEIRILNTNFRSVVDFHRPAQPGNIQQCDGLKSVSQINYLCRPVQDDVLPWSV